MQRFLTSLIFVILLLPALSGAAELGEWRPGLHLLHTLKFDDVVVRKGVYYGKSSDVPFTGKRSGQFLNYLSSEPAKQTTGKIQFSFRAGVLHGPFIKFHENGQLWEKGAYREGQPEGLWVVYYSDGELEQLRYFKEGKQDDPWINFYSNGNLFFKKNLVGGKFDGPQVNYHFGGQLSTRENFKDGVPEGSYIHHTEDGDVQKMEPTGRGRGKVPGFFTS